MFAASLAKAVLSAAVVGALLVVLRHASPRTSGLAAAVPINSMPALFWLSLEHGGGYAATVALGSLWGTGLTALLGLTFARLASICHASVAALLAIAVIGCFAALIWELPLALTVATGAALIAILVGQVTRPRESGKAPRARDAVAETLRSMGVAGLMSLVVSELSQHGGAQFCGVVATIPVIGITALYASHRRGGALLMFGVLDGYLTGMLAKAAFLGALFLAWGAGAGLWAWAIALAGATATLLAQRSLQNVRYVRLRRLT
jgi:hypothetical protein